MLVSRPVARTPKGLSRSSLVRAFYETVAWTVHPAIRRLTGTSYDHTFTVKFR
jgi:hypothetical protein